MRNKRKINIVFILLFIVLFIGIGYAYLNTTLSINGNTDVDANTWNVYWNNVQVTSGSVTGSQVTTAPTIDSSKTAVTFQVRLSKPGDYYEFTVDAKNDGSIDAMVDTSTKTTNIPTYLKYTVSYDDGQEISSNHLLTSNSTVKYKVRVEYRSDINPTDLPSTPQSTTLSFGVTYNQADGNAVVRYYYVYTSQEYPLEINIGSPIPSGIATYDTANAAAAAFHNRKYFLKHKIADGIVTESYAGVLYNGNAVIVRGGATDNPQQIYEENKAIMISAFGANHCSIDTPYTNGQLQGIGSRCDDGAYGIFASSLGSASSNSDGIQCYVNIAGDSSCSIW